MNSRNPFCPLKGGISNLQKKKHIVFMYKRHESALPVFLKGKKKGLLKYEKFKGHIVYNYFQTFWRITYADSRHMLTFLGHVYTFSSSADARM